MISLRATLKPVLAARFQIRNLPDGYQWDAPIVLAEETHLTRAYFQRILQYSIASRVESSRVELPARI